MKNYHFKGLIVLVLILLNILFSCQDEEFEIITPTEIKESLNYKGAKLTYNDVKDIPSLDLFVSNKIQGQRQKNSNSQTVLDTPFGILSLENVMTVTDTIGRVNYTFPIKMENPSLSVFYNLVVYQSESSAEEPIPYVVQYKMSDDFFEAYYSGQKEMKEFKGSIANLNFEDFTNNFARIKKAAGGCSDNGEDDGIDQTICEDPVDVDLGDGTGDTGDYIEIEGDDTVSGNGNNSNGDGVSTDGGGGDNTGDGDADGGVTCESVEHVFCCDNGLCDVHTPRIKSYNPTKWCTGSTSVIIETCTTNENFTESNTTSNSKIMAGGCPQGQGTVGIADALNLNTAATFNSGIGFQRLQWLNQNCAARKVLFAFWNTSPMTNNEATMSAAMIDFLKLNPDTDEDLVLVLDMGVSISNEQYFDITPYIENIPVEATGYTIAESCCPNDPFIQADPLYGAELGLDLARGFLYGLANIFQTYQEIYTTHEYDGKRIRLLLQKIGDIDVSPEVTNESLGEIYSIRKRGGALVVEYDSGFVGILIDLGISTLDVVALLIPSSGGGAYLAVQGGGKITSAALKGYLAKIAQGAWKTTNESMSDAAKAYQEFITKRKWNESFEFSNSINTVKFDGVKKGVLVEAKSGHLSFTNINTGQFKPWWANSPSGGQSMVVQAKRQIAQAEGVPIEWHFQHEVVMQAAKHLFTQNGVDISKIIFKFTPL